MARLFGTDGARGIANVEISVELAMKIGRAIAAVLTEGRRRRPLIVVGKDTRISSDMLEAALTAGLCSVGADVISLGVVPTPATAWLVKFYKADAGIMISASHNSYQYNGIKVFDGEGFKLPNDLEERIESLVFNVLGISLANESAIGTISFAKNPVKDYVEHLKSSVPTSLDGLRVVVDCANGSASNSAKQLFTELGVEVDVINNSPNGTNINDKCGSTNMQNLCERVKELGFDAGIAFDGDADRCLCVDEKGNIIDGDAIMAICALDLKNRGKLRRNTIVGTIMANMGLSKFCDEHGINFIPTKVGDRYVSEEMEVSDYRFGGEQSGHIIFRDYGTTGDGQLTAVQLLCHLRNSGKKFSEIASIMKKYPQAQKNIRVSPEGRLAFYNNDKIKALISECKETLGEEGRIVVRVSGTEPLIRVMTEGVDENKISKLADDIAGLIESELAGLGNVPFG